MEKKAATAIMFTLLIISMLTSAFNIQLIGAESETRVIKVLADGSSSKNMTFVGPENKTEYIKLPKTCSVSNARLNVTGFSLGTKTGEVYRNVAYGQAGLGSPDPKPYIKYIDDSEIFISAITVKEVWNPGILYTYIGTDPTCSPGTIKFSACYSFGGGDNIIVTIPVSLPMIKNDYLILWWSGMLGVDWWGNYDIVINETWSMPSGHFPVFNIYVSSGNANSPYINVANSSYPWEWYYVGEFGESVSPQVADLNASLINAYLSTSIPDSEGNVSVPLLFHSDSFGILEISDIQIFVEIPRYQLTITTTAGGTTVPAPGTYTVGACVRVTAIPKAGYQLDHWSLDGSPSGSANPISVLMDSNHTLEVVFAYVGGIYIRADGSIDPPDVPISTVNNVTYILTGNIYDSIVVERDNIVVDGASYTLRGAGSGTGIDLSNRNNVTIKNMETTTFSYSIWLWESSNNIIYGNNLTNNYFGIFLYSSSNNNISRNNITANNDTGIWLDSSLNNCIFGNNITANDSTGVWLEISSNNTLLENIITRSEDAGIGLSRSSNNILRNNCIAGNTNNFYIEGDSLLDYVNDVDTSNTVDGKPIYYWINETDKDVPLDAGYVALVNCTRMTGRNLNLTKNRHGILLAYTIDSIITSNYVANNGLGVELSSSINNSIYGNSLRNNMVWGILLVSSSNNNVSRNSIENGDFNAGILLSSSANNSVSRNNITGVGGYGLWLVDSPNNIVFINRIANNNYGIRLDRSSSNLLAENDIIENNYEGVIIYQSSNNNTLAENNIIKNNGRTIDIHQSSQNRIYHNNFINNAHQVYIENSVNVWDDGYPSGGNYWSDHVCTGNPSSGSQPCIIDDNNIDHYPFEDPSGWLPPAKTADLSVSSPDISFSDPNPSENETTVIHVNVHNVGDENADNVFVRFYDATTLIGEDQISYLSHHSQAEASIEWTAQREGYHLVKVVVDPGDSIEEIDETNNEATRSVLVGRCVGYGGIVVTGNLSAYEALPGSFINAYGHASYNTTYGAGEPVAGASVTITVLGDAGQWTTHTINTGDYSQQITTPYYAGNCTVVVTVSDGTFSESINLPLAVLQPPEGVDLTLSPTDISFLPPDPLESDNVTVTAAIHNIGSLNATNVTLGFFINGDLVANNTLDFIPAQGTGTTSTWWIFTSGTNIITVKTYLNSPIPELNPNNNQASRNLYVYPAQSDPTPTNIYFSDNTPVANQNITLTAEVKNIGGLNVSNLTVAFYEDDNPIGERTIPYISGKGGTATSSLSHSFTNEGPHTIKVQVDPYQSIPEADENNNNYSKNIYVHLPSPDLTLSPSDITFSEYNPLNGTQITIYAAIHNIGELDAESVVVQLLDGNTEISLDTVPLIRNGSYETLNNTWTAMPPGLHSVKVRVDPNNAINESDENNNAATRTIYVYPLEQKVPDLAIYETDIVFSNTNPHPGENVTMYATVHNIGEGPAENVSVVFYVEDVQIGPVQTITSLPVDGNETLSTSWIGSEIGSHVAKAEIDPGYFIIESDKSNNVATRAIIVGKLRDAWETSFTGSDEHPIIDLAVLDGGLYAVADNRLYVHDGNGWSAIDAPAFVTSLEPYGGKLVVGGQGGLYCYDGTSFTLVFSVPTYIKVLGAYNSTLYAGTFLDKPPILYYCNGNADNPDNWHIDTSFSAILNFSGPFGSVDSFAEYDGNLYVTSGGNIYSYNETGWNAVKTFDDVYGFSCMQAYNDKLYLATRDQGWRKPLYQGGTGFSGRVIEFDGENWTTVLDHDYWVYSLEVYDGKLYAGTANKILTYNGTDWDTSFNATEGAYYALCFENYDGKIYVGMGNGYVFADPAPAKANPETIVVPEFSSNMILAVFMALTMLAVALTKRKRTRRFG